MWPFHHSSSHDWAWIEVGPTKRCLSAKEIPITSYIIYACVCVYTKPSLFTWYNLSTSCSHSCVASEQNLFQVIHLIVISHTIADSLEEDSSYAWGTSESELFFGILISSKQSSMTLVSIFLQFEFSGSSIRLTYPNSHQQRLFQSLALDSCCLHRPLISITFPFSTYICTSFFLESVLSNLLCVNASSNFCLYLHWCNLVRLEWVRSVYRPTLVMWI